MLLPGLYLAVIRFHTQILPANLLLSFAEAREGVPFTSVTELILLELAFELIREAGVRVPGALGNAIGIVGGLIIGDAAVSANLVSPIVVMIVALTALGSMVIPDEEFASAFPAYEIWIFVSGWLSWNLWYRTGIVPDDLTSVRTFEFWCAVSCSLCQKTSGKPGRGRHLAHSV